MDYRVDYVARDGTELHFTYEGLGLPYDIQDPEMDPITAKSSPEDHAKHQGFGTAYNGHFDHSGHLRGKLKLRGKTYPIDIVSTMDHSWGPRPESRSGSMAWGNIHFGRDLAIHSIFTIDPRAGEAYGPLAHGYVTENGECHGLVDGKGRVTERDGFYTLGVEVEVEDIRGKKLPLHRPGDGHLSLVLPAERLRVPFHAGVRDGWPEGLWRGPWISCTWTIWSGAAPFNHKGPEDKGIPDSVRMVLSTRFLYEIDNMSLEFRAKDG